METSTPDDTFAVYRGNPSYDNTANSDPLQAPAVWRYTGKDALAGPEVRAVEQFRRAIAETEKVMGGP